MVTKTKKPGTRTRLSREHREKEIITAARIVFIHRGYENATIAEIAESASPTLIRNVVFGAIEHYLWDIVAGTKREEAEVIADQLTHLIFNGIVSNTESSRNEINYLITKLNKLIDE